ncbi:MAG: hypothetical protein RIQ94_2775 [Pseudomonadota bacterium]|jgi:hypothetical protein
MRLADKVQEWLNDREWNDKIEFDEENQTSSVNFQYTINDQPFKTYIETDEKQDFLKFYFYAPFNALSKKHIDCAVLFNHINSCSGSGSITLDYDRGCIRWHHIIDVEETDPSVIAINNAFRSGTSTFSKWFDEISEVALTKTTAQEIIDRLNADSEEESPEEAVPDSI